MYRASKEVLGLTKKSKGVKLVPWPYSCYIKWVGGLIKLKKGGGGLD